MSADELLRRISLFADLPGDELAALANCLIRHVFAKEVILFHKGSPAQSLYLIESGTVRIFDLSDTGQEITLDIYSAGDCFGEASLLNGNLCLTGAIALDKTVTYMLPRYDFLRVLTLHPEVARRVMTLLVHRLDRAIAYAENLAFLDVPGRVATVLLDLAERSGKDGERIELDLHLTQTELASWCVASREIINRTLHTYREQGLIAMTGHTIIILDRTGLLQRARS
jgi:CRP/FNR family transcriptional regulator, cyclic AMP receptor protein